MVMFDLAGDDIDLSTTYEQAALSIWEWDAGKRHQLPKAADRHIRRYDHPETPQDIVDESITDDKHRFSDDKKGTTPGQFFSAAILNHNRVSELNKGWGIVLGDAIGNEQSN